MLTQRDIYQSLLRLVLLLIEKRSVAIYLIFNLSTWKFCISWNRQLTVRGWATPQAGRVCAKEGSDDVWVANYPDRLVCRTLSRSARCLSQLCNYGHRARVLDVTYRRLRIPWTILSPPRHREWNGDAGHFVISVWAWHLLACIKRRNQVI